MELITLISGIVCLVMVVMFFITVSNIGDLVKITRALHSGQVGIQSSLDRIVQLLGSGKPVTEEDKVKAYDAIESAKKKLI